MIALLQQLIEIDAAPELGAPLVGDLLEQIAQPLEHGGGDHEFVLAEGSRAARKRGSKRARRSSTSPRPLSVSEVSTTRRSRSERWRSTSPAASEPLQHLGDARRAQVGGIREVAHRHLTLVAKAEEQAVLRVGELARSVRLAPAQPSHGGHRALERSRHLLGRRRPARARLPRRQARASRGFGAHAAIASASASGDASGLRALGRPGRALGAHQDRRPGRWPARPGSPRPRTRCRRRGRAAQRVHAGEGALEHDRQHGGADRAADALQHVSWGVALASSERSSEANAAAIVGMKPNPMPIAADEHRHRQPHDRGVGADQPERDRGHARTASRRTARADRRPCGRSACRRSAWRTRRRDPGARSSSPVSTTLSKRTLLPVQRQQDHPAEQRRAEAEHGERGRGEGRAPVQAHVEQRLGHAQRVEHERGHQRDAGHDRARSPWAS